MTLYLNLNGTSDFLQLPSMSTSDIYIDVSVASTNSGTKYLYRARSGSDNPQIQWTTDRFSGVGITNFTTTQTGATNPALNVPVATNQKMTVHFWNASAWSTFANTTIGRDSLTASGFMAMNIYDVKIYNGATLLAHYDMSTGTVQDQSGNGRHATLTGGTWLDDGTGGGTTPTDATITSLIANTSADTLAPTVSTVSSVSTSINAIIATMTADTVNPTVSTDNTITSIIAGASADALNPSVSLSSNINVITIVADIVADAFNPFIDLSGSITITAIVANTVASTINPVNSTDSVLSVPIGTSNAVVLTPGVGTLTSVVITTIVASVTADISAPSVAAFKTFNEIVRCVLEITRKQTTTIEVTRLVRSTLEL